MMSEEKSLAMECCLEIERIQLRAKNVQLLRFPKRSYEYAKLIRPLLNSKLEGNHFITKELYCIPHKREAFLTLNISLQGDAKL